jgi:hypothetical protein
MVTIIFKFMNATWIEADNLTVKDMGLLIDKDEKIMYVWEGKYVSLKTSTAAKEVLSRKRAEYPLYKVRSVKKEMPEHISDILNTIIIKSEEEDLNEYKKNSKIDLFQKILSLFTFLVLLFVVIRLIVSLNFNEFSISAQFDILFPSDLNYSRFMQNNLILSILSLILLTSLQVLYFLTKSVVNIIFTNISIILLIYHLIWTWNFQGSIVILGIASLIMIPTLFLPSKKPKTKI